MRALVRYVFIKFLHVDLPGQHVAPQASSSRLLPTHLGGAYVYDFSHFLDL